MVGMVVSLVGTAEIAFVDGSVSAPQRCCGCYDDDGCGDVRCYECGPGRSSYHGDDDDDDGESAVLAATVVGLERL